MKTVGEVEDNLGRAHEFFGMGMVVGKAQEAEDAAVKDLKDAFAGAKG